MADGPDDILFGVFPEEFNKNTPFAVASWVVVDPTTSIRDYDVVLDFRRDYKRLRAHVMGTLVHCSIKSFAMSRW